MHYSVLKFITSSREVIKSHRLRILKFLSAGGIALLIDFIIYTALTRIFILDYIASRVVSISIAIYVNYSINRVWTFANSAGAGYVVFLRFITVIITTSALNILIMYLGITIFKYHDLFIFMISSAIVAVLNYSLHSLWTYNTN